MKLNNLSLVIALVIASISLAACSKNSEETADEAPSVQVAHLEGDQPTRVTLSADAAERLDIQTDTVRAQAVDGAERQVIPYSSILYDTQGNTWIYTSPEHLTYVRTPVKVDSIRGDAAVLLAGPPTGTAVVTVGAEELFGSETEFEEE